MIGEHRENASENGGIESIKKIIDESPAEIQREFEGESGNDWFACLIDRMSIILSKLKTEEMKGSITPEDYDKYRTKIDVLNKKTLEFRAEHERERKDRSVMPDEATREELIKGLDIFIW